MVLYGGKRRRRLGKPFLAFGVLVALGAGLAAWQLWPSAGSGEVSAAALKDHVPVSKTPRAARSAPAPPLLAVHGSLARGIRISAQSGILVDARSGTVLWAKHPHQQLPIASTTKIMTAILAMHRLGPNDVVVVDRSVPRVQPFKEGLRAGEHVPAWKLYYGLLLYSGNDDALALAIAAGRTRAHFIALMNQKARQLGLNDTHFRSTSGIIDRGNYSSAWDMAALARYAMWNRLFRKVVRTRVRRVRWAAPTYSKIYVNHNHLLGSYRGADGVKTGWTTRAKHCLVASAHRGPVRLIAVALGSPNAYPDVRKLLNYGFATRG